MYLFSMFVYQETCKLYQDLHLKLGQQTPSTGTRLPYFGRNIDFINSFWNLLTLPYLEATA